MEKGKLDFMLNFEEFGKENGEIMGGLMVDGMKKMLKESSGCFESVIIYKFNGFFCIFLVFALF